MSGDLSINTHNFSFGQLGELQISWAGIPIFAKISGLDYISP